VPLRRNPVLHSKLHLRGAANNTGRTARTASSASSSPPLPVLLLTRTVHQRDTVAVCCGQAFSCGIRPGMTLAHAKALLPENLPASSLIIEPHHPNRDTAALRHLAAWCARMAPLVGLAPESALQPASAQREHSPDTLIMDITGCERLYPDPSALIRRVRATLLRRFGIHARVASAPTLAAAWALARYGPHTGFVLSPDQGQSISDCIRQAVHPLPVAALRVAQAALLSLHDVGIHTVEHLLALPRRSIALRYGQATLTRIDQLFGDLVETIVPIRPEPPPQAERVFDGPVADIGVVTRTTHGLLAELVTALDTRHKGLRTLQLTMERLDVSSRTHVQHTIRLARPSRSLRHIWALLEDKVQATQLAFGVERITLVAVAIGKVKPSTLALQQVAGRVGEKMAADIGSKHTDSDTPRSLPPVDETALGELLDTLHTRLGPQRVMQAVPISGRGLGRSGLLVPASGDITTSRFEVPVTSSARPPILLASAEHASVMALVPDGPPVRIGWRGRTHTIIDFRGPERLADAAAAWWAGSSIDTVAGSEHALRDAPRELLLPADSDLFRIQLESGLWLWLQRDNNAQANARWLVRGIWL